MGKGREVVLQPKKCRKSLKASGEPRKGQEGQERVGRSAEERGKGQERDGEAGKGKPRDGKGRKKW